MLILLPLLSSCGNKQSVIVNAQEIVNVDQNNIDFNDYKGELKQLGPINIEKSYPFFEVEDITNQIMEEINNYNTILNNVYDVCRGIVGIRGDCIYIAKLFIARYFGEGHNIAKIYEVDVPKPGDILYYANGGLGIEHWGIYIDENHSLQGNFNGRAIIYDGYLLNGATYPIFYRVK